ncbi:MAG: hypothetical protein KDH94_03930, partial [Coxiellaceae bacterium]|nr:hypothetical protein [Coxiellaceae bacterium]
DDGQHHNWRYYYAKDETNTAAFKRLSPKKQAWMIFTLMSGNDQSKLLALSILQDPSLALTQTSRVEGRGYREAIVDAWRNSTLAGFFEAYLEVFCPLPADRSNADRKEYMQAIFKELYGVDANEVQLRIFQLNMTNQARVHLLWLTDNATGRLKSLLEESVHVAVKLFKNFLAEIETVQAHDVERSYAVSTKPQEVAPGLRATIDDVQATAKSPKQDGSLGFSVFGPQTTRKKVVDLLLPHVSSNEMVFQSHGGTLTLRQFIAQEIEDLLRDESRRHFLPAVFTQRPNSSRNTLADGLELLEKLKLIDQKIEEMDQRISDIEAITPTDTRLDELRKEVDRMREQRATSEEEINRGVTQFCQREDVVRAYLTAGIGFHLPLGERTAALFAAYSGYQVEIYKANGSNLDCVYFHEHKKHEIFRLLQGDDTVSWSVFTQAPSVDIESRSVAAQPMLSMASQEVTESFGYGVALGNEPQAMPSAIPTNHPMLLRVIELFWSIADKDKQDHIHQALQFGHPARGTQSQALADRADLLFTIDSPEKIQAVKDGVLQCVSVNKKQAASKKSKQPSKEQTPPGGNLWPLLKMLRNDALKGQAFTLLAELFLDPINGIDFQRSFKTLVQEHYDYLTSARQIKAFREWLDHEAPAHLNSPVVRSRYAAVMLTEINKKFLNSTSNKPSEKVERFQEVIGQLFPQEDLFTCFDHLSRACSSNDESDERVSIFRFMVSQKLVALSNAELSVDPQLMFLSADGKTDLLDRLYQGFDGDIAMDARVQAKVHSWGALLDGMIKVSYPGFKTYIDGMINQICEAIANGTLNKEQSLNLGLVLLNALDQTAVKHLDLSKYVVMHN